MKHRRLWITLIVVAVLFTAVYVAAGWYFSGLIIATDTESLAEAATEAAADGETPADFGLPEPENIAIQSGDVTLSGWYFDNPADAGCGLMFLHGFHGTRYNALNWAPMFWERGCDILAYDHRGHGDSTNALHTYGFYEKEDAIAALDWFTARSGLERSQIGVFGVSYGASTALQMAPMTPEIAFVAADSPYSELEEIVDFQGRAQFPTLAPLVLPAALRIAELRADFDVDAVAPERSIAEITVPVLLIHSLTDEYTVPTHSEDIYANSDKSRTVLDLTDWDSPHARDIVTDPVAYEQLVNDFLSRFVPNFGLTPTP